MNAASSGAFVLSESYLYTVEALHAYVDHLQPGGLLAITRWLKLPPRDSLKLFATAAEALRRERAAGRDHPAWEQALKRCAEHWVKNQSPEGAYPHWAPDFGPEFKENEYAVTNVEAGVMANMADALGLTYDQFRHLYKKYQLADLR